MPAFVTETGVIVFPTAIPQRIAAAAPNAELHLIVDQTHSLLFRQPWRVAKIVLEFLHRHPLPAQRYERRDAESPSL